MYIVDPSGMGNVVKAWRFRWEKYVHSYCVCDDRQVPEIGMLWFVVFFIYFLFLVLCGQVGIHLLLNLLIFICAFVWNARTRQSIYGVWGYTLRVVKHAVTYNLESVNFFK